MSTNTSGKQNVDSPMDLAIAPQSNDLANSAIKVAFPIKGKGGVHESITKQATIMADMTYGNLIEGVRWPDVPTENPIETSYRKLVVPNWVPLIGGDLGKPGTITNESHNGKYQYWHSMAPSDRQYTNGEVKDKIIEQAIEWYEQAKSENNTFHLGKVLHMIQDSYVLSHVQRNSAGKIHNFQSYNEQDSHEHGVDEMLPTRTVTDTMGNKHQVQGNWGEIPGAMQALGASTQILKLYKSGASSKELADYLRNHVYQFESEHTKDTPAGGTDPKYAPKPKTSVAENTSTPEIKADEPIGNGWSVDDGGYLKGTLKEYLTLHHGQKNAESIMVSMQETLSAPLHSANQNAQFDRG